MNCEKTSIYKVMGALILVSLFIPQSISARNVIVTAHVDRQQVTLYERLTYTLTVEADTRNIPDPILPDFKGFRVLGSPRTSSQFSWVNGRIQNSRAFSYLLEARTEGSHTFSPASVKIAGNEYLSNAVSISVTRPGPPDASTQEKNTGSVQTEPGKMETLFVELNVDNNEPYVGEPVRVSLHVFTRVNIRDYGIQEEPDYQGFWVETVDLPPQPALNTRIINNIEYGEAKIHEVILYPTVSGELLIPPLIVAFQVQDRQRDPFDHFFNSPFQSNFFGTRKEIRSTKTGILQVKPLPTAGKPNNFSGAVGTFNLKASINSDTVKAGEAVIVTVTLSGKHGMKTIAAPKAPSLKEFKVFDPKSGDILPDPEMPGWRTRSFDYIFVPHQPGEHVIPGFSFSYFDTDTRAYQTLATEQFHILVTAAPGGIYTGSSQVDGKEMTLLNIDTRYIKTTTPVIHYSPPYKKIWFIASLILPVMVTPLVLFIDTRKRRLKGDETFAREVRARSVSEKRFKEAWKAWNDKDVNASLDAAARAFSHYLADRLGLPAGGITLNSVEQALRGARLDEDMVEKIRQYWMDLDAMRYSPVELPYDEGGAMIEKGRKIIEKLEKVKLKNKTAGHSEVR
jgi:hypothetical protein